MQDDPFEAALAQLQASWVDLDGDGQPDMPVTTADILTEMAQGRRRPAPGLPDYLRQSITDAQTGTGQFAPDVRANAVHPMLGGLGEAASFGAEMTGIPGMMRGGRNVLQGIDEGDPLRSAYGAGEAALGALPGASLARPVAGALLSSAPRAAATLGAPMAAMAPLQISEARAAGADKAASAVNSDPEVMRLRDEMRQLEQERLQASSRSIKGLNRASADAARERADRQYAEQIAAKRDEIMQAQDRAQQAFEGTRSFRDANPEMVSAIMAGGGALAFGLPFANAVKGRMAGSLEARRLGREADDIVAGASRVGPDAPPVADLAMRQGRLDQAATAFNARNQGGMSTTAKTAGGVGLSGLTMAEASVLPEQLDYMLNPPGHPARQQASELFSSGDYYKERVAPILLGMGLGASGSKVGNLMTPAPRLDQSRIDAARNLGTPDQFERMNRIGQHREWVSGPPGPMPASPGAGGGPPPGGRAAGGGGAGTNLPQGPTPGPQASQFAMYDQSGPHGQVAQQFLRELMTDRNPTRKAFLKQHPQAMATELARRIEQAGLPPVNPNELMMRVAASINAGNRTSGVVNILGPQRPNAELRQKMLGVMQGHPGMLSVPMAAGIGGTALNALAPYDDDELPY